MSKLSIKNLQKPSSSISFQETFREENLNNCDGSVVNFSLIGNGTFPIKMTSSVTPGGGYVTLTTSGGNVINVNGSLVNSVQFFPGWTYPDGGDHSRIDDLIITVNGTVNFVLSVMASSTGVDDQNQLVMLTCWDGLGDFATTQANCTLEHEGVDILHLLNFRTFDSPVSGQQPN